MPVNIALVGGGRIADMHAPGYIENPEANLYALCDVNAELCRRREAEWGLARLLGRLRARRRGTPAPAPAIAPILRTCDRLPASVRVDHQGLTVHLAERTHSILL